MNELRFTFEVPGEPVSKLRARHVNGIAYTPEKTKNYETLVKELYIVARGPYFGESDIKVFIIAYFGIPKSKSKKKQDQMRTGEIRPHKKPDADNICKIICDALNGIAYKDDSQIVDIVVRKYYHDKPSVSIEIQSLNGA